MSKQQPKGKILILPKTSKPPFGYELIAMGQATAKWGRRK